MAVAAASILTRDKFLAAIEKLGQECGTELPKGASDAVVKVVLQHSGRSHWRALMAPTAQRRFRFGVRHTSGTLAE